MDVIRFCRDSVLRRTFVARNADTGERISWHVPLRVWEEAADPDIFLKALQNYILFEEALTVGELMENLAPWANTMTGVAAMDFPAFLAEVRREPTAPEEKLSHIALRYKISIRPVPAFEKQEKLLYRREDGYYVFNPAKRVRTGRLTVDGGWDSHAILKQEHRAGYDGAESISLDCSPTNAWKHLPTLVDAAGMLCDETAVAGNAAYLGTRKALTRKDDPNVVTGTLPNGQSGMNEIPIDAPLPTFFDAIIRGFLWEVGFHYSPEERDRFCEGLQEQLVRLDAGPVGIEEEEKELDRLDQARFAADLAMLEKLEAAASRLELPLIENCSQHVKGAETV